MKADPEFEKLLREEETIEENEYLKWYYNKLSEAEEQLSQARLLVDKRRTLMVLADKIEFGENDLWIEEREFLVNHLRSIRPQLPYERR